MEIQHLYSFDIFLQGFFLLICISSGLFILFKDNLERFKNINSINKFSEGLHKFTIQGLRLLSFQFGTNEDDNKPVNYFGFLPLIVMASFIFGIIGFTTADEWIDSSDVNHLSFNKLWSESVSETKNNFDYCKNIKCKNYKKLIRFKAFSKVFHKDVTKENERQVEQLYYHAKHKVLKDKEYFNYIRKSQSLVEYCRVFALGFFFLFICSLLNLLIMIIRVSVKGNEEFEEQEESEKYSSPFRKIVNISNGVILIFNLTSFSVIFIAIQADLVSISSNYMNLFLHSLPFFGCATFLLLFFQKFRRLRFSFFIYSIIYVVSFIGYFSSAKLWLSNEGKVAKKVYGILKSNFANDETSEIEYAKNELCLTNLLNSDKQNKNNK